ncbi:MAG TPA: cytochrome c [Verrucomicrobiales bacterium]|nr:cytochrome c [Verrucomicrobiales bacterium]
MRYFLLAFLLLGVLAAALIGYRGRLTDRRPLEFFNDMDQQQKVKYQATSRFFADGVGSRRPVAGTVPMGFAVPDRAMGEGGAQSPHGFALGADYLNTGRIGDYWGNGMPEGLSVDAAFLERGRRQFEIYCAVCHGSAGDGMGVASRLGLSGVADLHQVRLRDEALSPDGELFNTISHGKGNMGAYGTNLTLYDRWSVVAYLRVLQSSRSLPLAEVEEEWKAWQADQENPKSGSPSS